MKQRVIIDAVDELVHYMIYCYVEEIVPLPYYAICHKVVVFCDEELIYRKCVDYITQNTTSVLQQATTKVKENSTYYMVVKINSRKDAQVYLNNVKNDKRKIVVGLKQGSNYFVTVSKVAAESGLSAKTIVARFNDRFGGNGGGKDTFAQGGVKEDFTLIGENFTLDDLEQVIIEVLKEHSCGGIYGM